MERAQLSIEWLVQARIERGWTQEYVAERIDVAPATVRRWESCTHKPRLQQYYQLCKLFKKELPPHLQVDTVPDESIEDTQASAKEERQVSLVVFPQEADDACTKFLANDLTIRLLHIVWKWSLRSNTARYHELQSLLMQEIEREDNTTMPEHPINRRNALRRIAALPIDLYGLSLILPTLLHAPEELLMQCSAGITACWYLRKGKDLTFTYDAVSHYIPTLQGITTSGTTDVQRSNAAELLVQCFLLQSILAWHVNTSNAITHAQSAEKYALAARNGLLQVVALRTQAAALCYANSWGQALHAAEKAKYLLETTHGVPQLVHSYVYAGLATYQAYSGRKDDALTSLKKAHSTFFAPQSTDEVVPIWIDHSIGNLLINDGLTHYHLGMHKGAIDSFEQINGQYASDSAIPVACHIESLINQVMAEVDRDDQPRNLDRCIDCWTEGIDGAKTLQSSQRFNEAVIAYTTMRAVWPGEHRVKQLREHIIHW